VFTAAYLYRLPGAALGDASSPAAGPADPDTLRRMADYLVTYMGLPWTRSGAIAPLGKTLGGAFFVGGAAAALVYGVARPASDRLQRLGVALIAFTLASALLATVGRVDIEPDVRVPVRYAVFVAPLHVGLLLLAWPFIGRLRERASTRRFVNAAALGVGVLLLAQQVVSGEAAAATTRSMRATLDRFAAGEESEEMKTVVFVNLTQARRDLNAIRAAGLYLTAR
jgi:hypothetical protein